MERTNKITFEKNTEAEKLDNTLEQLGMKEEKKDIETLLNYIEKLSDSYNKLENDFSDMKKQLSLISNPQVKNQVEQIVVSLRSDVTDLKYDIKRVNKEFNNNVSNAINNIKIASSKAFIKTIDFVGIQKIIQNIQEKINRCTISLNNGIMKIENIKNAISNSKEHMKNAGRELVGKEIQELKDPVSDKGILHGVQKSLSKVSTSLYTIGETAKSTSDKIDIMKNKYEKTEKANVIKTKQITNDEPEMEM